MIKSPPFKERKLLHFTCTSLSYIQYSQSGETFCSPAKYSFLPEYCHSSYQTPPLLGYKDALLHLVITEEVRSCH